MNKFTINELVFARIVMKKLRRNRDLLPLPYEQETVLYVNFQLQTQDVSLMKKFDRVSVNYAKYKKLMWVRHITVHNHPSGCMEPSEGDFKYAGQVFNLSSGKSVWHMIVSPDLQLYTLFGVGRITKILCYG